LAVVHARLRPFARQSLGFISGPHDGMVEAISKPQESGS
jgi:hypothetical protein